MKRRNHANDLGVDGRITISPTLEKKILDSSNGRLVNKVWRRSDGHFVTQEMLRKQERK